MIDAMLYRAWGCWTLCALLLAFPCAAQRVFYFPKPTTPTAYRAPMKPLTRLADLKAAHRGQVNWRQLVIDDGNTKAWVISAAPGVRAERHLFPDSPAWWVIQEGRMRFEIDYPEGKGQTIEARKGSYVFVPERHLHSWEVIGDGPSIRLEVRLAEATPVYEKKPDGSAARGIDYIPVRLSTGLNADDVPNRGGKPDRIHVNIADLEVAHAGQSAWSEPAMRKNRVRGNFIYGHAKDNPKRRPGDRGHFHADFAEFWIVLRGQLRWIMEGIEQPLLAGEGDIVYAPPRTFHIPEFYGEGPACRLTSSTYPGANHIFDAPDTARTPSTR